MGDYAMHPIRGFRQFMQLLVSNFGGKFVGMIICNYLGVKVRILTYMRICIYVCMSIYIYVHVYGLFFWIRG